LGRFLLAIGAAAILVLGFAILAAWARTGYFVAFDEDGNVAVYQGRHGGLLWFEPTIEANGPYSREQLDAQSVALVEQQVGFESRADAISFVASNLSPTTTTTTTTTTTPPTTTTIPTPTTTAGP
jgi:PPM family protein phosphatase